MKKVLQKNAVRSILAHCIGQSAEELHFIFQQRVMFYKKYQKILAF